MKTLNKSIILASLVSNPNAVKKALVILYRRQTADEQKHRDTKHSNKQGFNTAHAKEGTRLARKILAGENLSLFELKTGFRIASYYAGTQLLEAAKVKRDVKASEQGRSSDAIFAARIANLDPFNQNVKATPRQVRDFISVFGE